MADAAIFVGFGQPARAREPQALDAFNETLHYYSEAQGRGEIESFEPVLLDPHGGDLGGFILIRGSREQMQALKNADEFRRLTTRATLVVEGLGVVDAYINEGLGAQMTMYEEQVRAQLAS